ncbi:type IIL restriction-modification enzyme MmeI [Streptomyces sp. NPDC023723]|uniref:type IIL restriction-modification enzyme MmeI n=1 Tax=Streptomyces sp. NPDC023723 TaxID=3154323 RepID=UPI00340A65C4
MFQHRLVSGDAPGRPGAYIGSYVLGKGFILPPQQAEELIHRDPRNRDVLFRYLNGEDLNSRPDCSASRWVINFHDWPEEQAREYPDVFAIVERDVKPERLKITHSKNAREKWWLYERSRPDLYSKIRKLDRVLVVARVSKTGLPVFVPTGQVTSEQTVVFASDRLEDLTWLNSGIHYTWAIARGSSLKGDLRYTPSDIYETLPQPSRTTAMATTGAELDRIRRSIMSQRKVGLTRLYNLVHDPSVIDGDIQALRAAHVEVDHAVVDAYNWQDLNLYHGFTTTRQGMRFSLSQVIQTEVIDRLLELNYAQHTGKADSVLF